MKNDNQIEQNKMRTETSHQTNPQSDCGQELLPLQEDGWWTLTLRKCAWCSKDLGFAWVPHFDPQAGRISHGICPQCREDQEAL